jgi:hypothetical protein
MKIKNLTAAAAEQLFAVLAGWALLLISCSQKANSVIPEDQKNAGEISTATLLTANEIYVNDVGANGTDTLDDTPAFQKAIDSMAGMGGGMVRVRTGTYYINVDTAIKMKSNVTLYMYDSTRILKAKPTVSGRSYMLLLKNISNATIMGGKLIGEWSDHLGGTCTGNCEQGFGIAIYSCNNIKVTRSIIRNCWGDGITVGARAADGATATSQIITLHKVICDSNRRQGLTIGYVDSLIVDSCKFTRTTGTKPKDGIDIEPDNGTAQRVYIKNCEMAYNDGNGIEMNAKTNGTAVIKKIYAYNNYIHHNAYSAYVQHVQESEMKNNYLTQNRFYGNRIYTVDTSNCVFTPNTFAAPSVWW